MKQTTHKSFRDMALAIGAIDRQKAEALRRSRPLAKRQTKITPGPRIGR